jgi:hypothetical protein
MFTFGRTLFASKRHPGAGRLAIFSLFQMATFFLQLFCFIVAVQEPTEQKTRRTPGVFVDK